MRSISASVGDQNDTSHGPLWEAARAAAVQPTRLEHPRFLDAVDAQTSFNQARIEDMSDNYLGQAFQRCAPRQPRDAGFQHPLQRKLIAPTAAVAVALFPRLGFERDKPCLSPS